MTPMRSSLLLACAILGHGGAPAGRMRRVPAEYRSVQEAIDSAAAGDTVLVWPGRYPENIRFGGTGIVVATEYLLTSSSRRTRAPR